MADTTYQQSSERKSPGAGEMQPTQDIVDYVRAYAQARPEVAAMWCFGVGFIIGWKLKPW